MYLLSWFLAGAGVFTLVLGCVHIFVPLLLDYRALVLASGSEKLPRAFRLWPTRYVATNQDRYGIIWVMNIAASYGLISIGLGDLFAQDWLRGAGRPITFWIAGWWLLRSGTELTLGRRWGDWLIMAWFAVLGAVHLWAALAR